MKRAVITYHDDKVQGSPEWLADRNGNYSGSNSYKLLSDIADFEYAKNEESTFMGNFHTERGHVLEDQAVKMFEQINNVKVEHTGYITNSHFLNCMYSPDGLPPEELIEVKSFGKKAHLELVRCKTELDIPLKIRAQIHWGFLISGRRKGWLVAYNPYFAKKEFEDENGYVVENPDYNPRLAYKQIRVVYSGDIANNFKKKLGAAYVGATV